MEGIGIPVSFSKNIKRNHRDAASCDGTQENWDGQVCAQDAVLRPICGCYRLGLCAFDTPTYKTFHGTVVQLLC